MKYHIWTEGCQMNVADSQRVGALLEQHGLQPADSIEQADVVILNSCVVRQGAENKVAGELGTLKGLKRRKPGLFLGLKWELLRQTIQKKINAPQTSSLGRLFDAISSILSVRDEAHYEGQAAIELEMIANPGQSKIYPFHIERGRSPMVIDPAGIIRGVVADLMEGMDRSLISGRFHETIVMTHYRHL